ncbi:DUF6911 family protein [Testudinibacter sp. P80/BLE/0925]|uniref:DUF6911 family protein n=1 Tax=Testudinibacter sp. TW-1 TaxID=3417757 RepID=UPI003D359D8A
MNKDIYFSCSYKINSIWFIACHEKKITFMNPIKDIIDIISYIENNEGEARLEIFPEPDFGVSSIRVIAYPPNQYLLTLAEYLDDGDLVVRTKLDTPYNPNLVMFDGDGEMYPSSAIIDDFDFVIKVFSIFLETGDVPYDLMDI